MSRWFPVAIAVAFLTGFCIPLLVASAAHGERNTKTWTPVRYQCPVLWYDLWTGDIIGCTNNPLWAPDSIE